MDDSKKRLRQLTIAQAFGSYNKKLKTELESSGSPLPSSSVEESADERPQKEQRDSAEVADSALGNSSQYSVDLFPDYNIDNSSDSDLLTSFTSATQSLHQLQVTAQHTVLVNYSSVKGVGVPEPFPKDYLDCWDGDHVRMPCSPANVYPVRGETGERTIESRWEIVRQSLNSEPLTSSIALEEAILTYNYQYSKRWDFRVLHSLFDDEVIEAERRDFFDHLLPGIIALALELPDVCTSPIPLLKAQRPHSITFSQKQIASLLANAFLCTFPRRNSVGRDSEYSRYPSINFNLLYSFVRRKKNRKYQKLRCFLNYFRRVIAETPTGAVTFTRQCPTRFPNWKESTVCLRRFHVQSDGRIETEGAGMLQVDFADKYIGGGVLNTGCVQEEIRFVLCPELVVSRLFTECLGDNEALLVTGCEQLNTYSGYGDSFVWEGDFQDETPRDDWGRRRTTVVAMDAIHFQCKTDQFKGDFLVREIQKAYCGFCFGGAATGEPKHSQLPAVATGNWGCGVFKGDARLKSLIQYIAASESGRDLVYFTFGNVELAGDIRKMVKFLRKRDTAVGQLWSVLESYYPKCISGHQKPLLGLYDHIYSSLQ